MRASTLSAVVLVALVFALSARAHGLGSHTGFVSRVSYIEPQVTGLLVEVIGGHERLSVRNLTQKTIVILDESARPALRLGPGEAGSVADPRIGSRGPPARNGEFVRNWRIRGTADGADFQIVGFLGYRAPPGEERDADDDRLPAWTVAAAIGGAVVVAAALALPLRRRKDEG